MPFTSFSDMPTLATATRQTPSPPFHRRRKSWVRRIERCCCQTFAYFPLAFVYSLTSWAVYVEVDISFLGIHSGLAWLRAGLGLVLYTLLNVSYSIAVFTNPGSPKDPKWDAGSRRRTGGGYEGLPTNEDDESDSSEGAVPREWMTAVTAKSTGKPRYCKKCKTVKPDRTHHCSTCGKCVLKMDHHCPWLATCVGLRNHKPFLLFLIYTSLFCWLCFGVSAWWVWAEIVDGNQPQGMRVVHTILLSVLGGIMGLVLSGFTGWHIYLVLTGQTTIECLEKTRYLTPLRKSMEHQFQQGRTYLGQGHMGDRDDQPLAERLKEIHANALPGVLRQEEGETTLTPSPSWTPTPPPPAGTTSISPAHQSLERSYASLEAQRERERYNLYLDEQDSEKMPNAFDLGWKRNLLHILGSQPLLWLLPVCNTSGNGWQWEVSPKWTEARDRIGREREQRAREEAHWNNRGQNQYETRHSSLQAPPRDLRWTPGQGFVDRARNAPRRYQNGGGGSGSGSISPTRTHANGSASMPMQPLDRSRIATDDGEADAQEPIFSGGEEARRLHQAEGTANWNDIPEDFIVADRLGLEGERRSRSRGGKKGD